MKVASLRKRVMLLMRTIFVGKNVGSKRIKRGKGGAAKTEHANPTKAAKWHVCMIHHRVEPDAGCPSSERLGPYLTEYEASAALKRFHLR